MSINSLKRDIRRIKHKESQNFDCLAFEKAEKRHLARLDILQEEKWADTFDLFDERFPTTESLDPFYESFSDSLRKNAKEARILLGDDTTARWKKDHSIIENYHKKTARHIDAPYDGCAFGGTPDDMWDHYEAHIGTFIENNPELEDELKIEFE